MLRDSNICGMYEYMNTNKCTPQTCTPPMHVQYFDYMNSLTPEVTHAMRWVGSCGRGGSLGIMPRQTLCVTSAGLSQTGKKE